MIRIENLVKSYGSQKVLKGINLEVQAGEIYGFIGHNGSGKSTTMNILTGLIGFQSGQCTIRNREVKANRAAVFQHIGYLPEEPKFYPYMNAWEYLSFIGTMAGDSKGRIKEKSGRLLELVKLSKDAKRAVGGYSRGMKQRLGMAVAMYNDAEILFLDEPSSALDPEGRKDVMDIVRELKNQRKTIFLSTHILNDLERVCDRVGILHDGRIVLEEKLEDLINTYIQPIYDVEFEAPLQADDIGMLEGSPLVERTAVEGKKVSLWLKDKKLNGNSIIRLLADTGVPIVSVNLRKASLEEIFLKVVK
jgi:ABC-type multidrug transport system, ATPase component